MIKLSFLIVCLLSIYCFSAGVYGQTRVDETFEGFAKGELNAAGQNIYISKNGEIRGIRSDSSLK